MTRSTLTTTLLAAAVAMATPGCSKEEPAPVDVVRPVKMMTVGAPTGGSERRYPGTVRPNEEVDLAFEVAGRSIELPVRRGDLVEEGDLLCRLDPRDYQNNRDAALAYRTETASTLERIKDLRSRNAATEKELIDAQADYDRAVAELRITEKALADTELKAPFDGIVANRFFENFEMVQAKQKVFSVQQIEVIKILINIPEPDVVDVHPDELGRFTVHFESLPDRVFEAEIKEAVTEADPVAQTFELSLVFPAPTDANILPGMTAGVTWYPNFIGQVEGDRLLVPSAAVFSADDDATPALWVIDRGTMQVSRRNVEIGPIVGGNQIEILGGVSPGEVVAVAGVHSLREGMKVKEWRGVLDDATAPDAGDADGAEAS